MAWLRSRARRTTGTPSPFHEYSPYCDRLTLAEPFHEDRETRATAEDRRAEPYRVIQATTSVIPSRTRQ